MAYHAGTLKALKDVRGLDAADAELIVGTSAGSVVAAYLRTGWSVEDLWALAIGTHPTVADLTPEERQAEQRAHLAPTWANRYDLLRRGVGSAAVMAQTLLPRVPRPPAVLGRHFPGGLYSMDGVRSRFEEEVGLDWPERPTYLCAHDLRSGRRVVFGTPGAPEAELPTAVMASLRDPGLLQAGARGEFRSCRRWRFVHDAPRPRGHYWAPPDHRCGSDGFRPFGCAREPRPAHPTPAGKGAGPRSPHGQATWSGASARSPMRRGAQGARPQPHGAGGLRRCCPRSVRMCCSPTRRTDRSRPRSVTA